MKRILVIDDEFTTRQVLSLTLEQEGYEVITAWNGQNGLTALAEQPVDLIICDVMMPIMTGPQMIRTLQQTAKDPMPPIILMSGSGEPVDSEGYQYDVFLDKPFHMLDLLAAIEQKIGSADGT